MERLFERLAWVMSLRRQNEKMEHSINAKKCGHLWGPMKTTKFLYVSKLLTCTLVWGFLVLFLVVLDIKHFVDRFLCLRERRTSETKAAIEPTHDMLGRTWAGFRGSRALHVTIVENLVSVEA